MAPTAKAEWQGWLGCVVEEVISVVAREREVAGELSLEVAVRTRHCEDGGAVWGEGASERAKEAA